MNFKIPPPDQALQILARREKLSAAASSNLTGKTMLGTLKYPVAPSLVSSPTRQSNLRVRRSRGPAKHEPPAARRGLPLRAFRRAPHGPPGHRGTAIHFYALPRATKELHDRQIVASGKRG